jgi:hypothetical protein
MLDLGEVKNLATVFINGKKVANIWKLPYQADITTFVKDGENQLEVQVTNTAINRLATNNYYWMLNINGMVRRWQNSRAVAQSTGKPAFATHHLCYPSHL